MRDVYEAALDGKRGFQRDVCNRGVLHKMLLVVLSDRICHSLPVKAFVRSQFVASRSAVTRGFDVVIVL